MKYNSVTKIKYKLGDKEVKGMIMSTKYLYFTITSLNVDIFFSAIHRLFRFCVLIRDEITKKAMSRLYIIRPNAYLI